MSWWSRLFLSIALAAAPSTGSAAPRLSFTALGPAFQAGARDYEAIWRRDGERIVEALEAASGLVFPAAPIEVIVSGGPPMTSFDGQTIRLRATYSRAYKQAALVHELGHALALSLGRPTGTDDHRLLYLFLHDAWARLYGPAFADRMVAIERKIISAYDYDAAWTWALSLPAEERRRRLEALRAAGPAQARQSRLGRSQRSACSTETPRRAA